MRAILIFCVASLFVSSASATDAKGTAFLEAKKKEEGVVALKSGLLYKVLRSGTGDRHPKVDTPCDTHYKGTLIDGTQFDSSYDRGSPTAFAPNQVIKGWTEAMQLMVEGDKWEMYIPSELAYGASGSPPKIPGDSALIFTMELLKIKGDSVPAARCDPATGNKCNERELKYIEKAKAMTGEERQKEQSRLQKISGSQMSDSAADYLAVRLRLLGLLNKQ